MKLVLFSDPHLRLRRGDEQFGLTQVIDYAITKSATDVIAAGDLFDRQQNRPGPVTFFCQQIERLKRAGIKFYYIVGQHDRDVDTQWLAAHSWAQHIHKKTVKIGPFTFYGLDCQNFGKLQEELQSVPQEADHMICHQTWSDWLGFEGASQGDIAQLPGHVRFMYSGDIHKWIYETKKNSAGRPVRCLSTGALCQQKIDEPSEHFCAVMEDDGTIKKVKLRSRRFIDWPLITTTEDMDEFVQKIDESLAAAVLPKCPEEIGKPLLRVSYGPAVPEAVARVEKIVGNRAFLYFKDLQSEEHAVPEGPSQVRGPAVTPLDVLSEEVNKDEHPEVFELVGTLLSPGDPALAFSRWRQEQLAED